MGKVHFLVHNVPHKEEKDILSCVEFPQNQVFCKMYVSMWLSSWGPSNSLSCQKSHHPCLLFEHILLSCGEIIFV